MSKTFYEFADKLIRSLDNRYNVIDMPTVLECITYFERANVTKIFLEETRVGKYVNELRRSTTDESLAKRTRELVRKWRHQLIPEQSTAANIVSSSSSSVTKSQHADQNNLKVTIVNNNNNSYCINNNKRLLNDEKQYEVKRIKRNGEYKTASPEIILIDNLSQNLNTTTTVSPVSSTLTSTATISTATIGIACLPVSEKTDDKIRTIIPSTKEASSIVSAVSTVTNLTPPVPLSENALAPVTNAVPASCSDMIVDGCSNSTSGSGDATFVNSAVEVITLDDDEREQKRNRRRNTRNRAKAIKEAETSFTNKLVAMTRCKVKTTQEILDDLQNRSQTQNQNTPNLKEIKKLDAPVAIAKLTEEIKKIDAKLKPAIQTSVNEIHRWRSNKNGPPTVIEIDSEDEGDNDDVMILEPLPLQPEPLIIDPQKILNQLPPIDWDQFNRDLEEDKLYECICPVGMNDTSMLDECPVKQFLMKKSNFPNDVTNKKLENLHYENIVNLNGNMGRPVPPIDYYPKQIEETDIFAKYDLYTNIVPDVYKDVIPKRFTKYDQTTPLSETLSDNDIGTPSSVLKNSSLLYQTSIPESDSTTTNPVANSPHIECNNSDESITDDSNLLFTPPPIKSSSLPANSDTNNFKFIEWHKCFEVPSYNQEFIRILPYVIID